MLSELRIAGIALGVVLAALGARRVLRVGTGSHVPGLLQIAAGCGITAVAINPELAAPIRDLLGLSAESPGRLLAVVIVSVGLAYPLIFYALNRAEDAGRRTGALVRALALADARESMPKSHPGDILVCLPAHNEGGNLSSVLEGIPENVAGHRIQILVVDDGSADRTAMVARSQGAHVVRHSVQLGGGGALRTGYLAAAEAGFEILVTLDADGQHDPLEMGRLLAPILNGEADFVLGSRRRGAAEPDSRVRRIGIAVYTWLLNTIGRMRLTDVSNGFRALLVSRVVELRLREEQFHNAELLLAVHRANLRIVEVPVTVRRRASGKSKKGTHLRYGLGFLRVLFRSWLQ